MSSSEMLEHYAHIVQEDFISSQSLKNHIKSFHKRV